MFPERPKRPQRHNIRQYRLMLPVEFVEKSKAREWKEKVGRIPETGMQTTHPKHWTIVCVRYPNVRLALNDPALPISLS